MKRTNFLAADLTAAINKTSVDVTDFTSAQPILAYGRRISLTIYVKGDHASCSKDITLKFATKDTLRDTWDTIDAINNGAGIALTMSGTTAIQKTILLSPGFEQIKLLSVQNPETVAGYTATVNASVFVAEQEG